MNKKVLLSILQMKKDKQFDLFKKNKLKKAIN